MSSTSETETETTCDTTNYTTEPMPTPLVTNTAENISTTDSDPTATVPVKIVDINLFTPSASTSTPKNPTSVKRASEDENEISLKHTHRDGKHYVQCIPCVTYPDVVKIHMSSQNKKLPAIASAGGTQYRKETVEKHFKTVYHAQALKKFKLASLSAAEQLQCTDIGKYISTKNEKLANKIGDLMLHVYCDAKKLTLSAWSFPARIVTGHVGSNFSFNSQRAVAEDVKNFDFQYVTPSFHLELLKCIVNSYRSTFRDLMENSVACSLRCDGSVDRMQIDKIYVAAKIVSKKGQAKQLFLGAAEPEERGANGILKAMKKALENTLGCQESANLVIRNASSLVTDGASVNTGEEAGLWSIFQKEKENLEKKAGAVKIPLIVIWCAVHRSALAWKSVTDTVLEVSHIIQTMSSISAYFHRSGVRTEELKKTSIEHQSKLLRFPKYFEVRWSEFTYDLINSILTSWITLVTYFREARRNDRDKKTARECSGYHLFLTNLSNLSLMAHLADVLSVFSHYQKKLQADTLTVVQIPKMTKSLKEQLEKMKTTPLLGGWVSELTANLTNQSEDDSTVVLHGITLQKSKPLARRKRHHLYVTEKRDIMAVVHETIESLKNFLDVRFSIDQAIIISTEKFVELQPDVDLKEVHRIWAVDVNLQQLGLEYEDILQYTNLDQLRRKTLDSLVTLFVQNTSTFTVGIVMSRILAAKPHSGDVERLISKNNLLKTSLRNSLNLDTENFYMFVSENMPPLEQWDPRPAVLSWLNEKDRRERVPTKARDQPWFRGILENHGDGDRMEEIEEEDLGINTDAPIKNKSFI